MVNKKEVFEKVRELDMLMVAVVNAIGNDDYESAANDLEFLANDAYDLQHFIDNSLEEG